ncbi:MAG: hypothetical protein JWR69_2455 [Pedosphaera sp.]|nr:hypothetical protein [Pedosphaera sp.]
MKRNFKILLVLCLALLAGFLVLLLPNAHSRRELTKYKEQLRAQGEKLLISELAPVFPLNPSNGAPKLISVVKNLPASQNSRQAMSMVAPGWARIGYSNVSPVAMLEYTQNLHAVSELRDALNTPVFDFHPNYFSGSAMRLDFLAHLKGAELLTSAMVVEALQAGDFSEARADLLASVDVIRRFNQEPLLISGLVRAAMAWIAVGATWEALQAEQWTDGQLAELQARWQELEFLDTAGATLNMERAMMIDTFAAARKSYTPTPAMALVSLTNTPTGSLLQDAMEQPRQTFNRMVDRYPRYWTWKASWSHDEELYCLQIIDAALTAARQAKASGAFVPAMSEFTRQATNVHNLHPAGDEHFRIVGFSPDGASYGRYLMKLADVEIMRRLMVTAIALKRFHLVHGAYPERLEILVPDYLQRPPIDPMDGKPLRYRLRPGGEFLLYSVGEDGEDNGGDANRVARGNLNFWVSARDAVWPSPATREGMEEYYKDLESATNGVAK